jgi:hypothetical protein
MSATATSMNRIELAGQLFDVDLSEVPRLERERARLEQELKELGELGIRVTNVSVPEDGAPPRYTFKFPEGELQYKTRLKVEKAGFDVGQSLGERQLAFYISRRTQKSEGWEV